MEKANSELKFWRDLFKSKEDYLSFRREDAKWKMSNFEGLVDRDGVGIDVGCGLVSVFEGLKNKIVAIDPLMKGYEDIIKVKSDIKYMEMSGEDIMFKDDFFDYAFCVNVIDHTPNPEKMASEIKRVVRPGGKIYFEVNFDDNLTECHYSKWNEETVNKVFGDLKCIFNKTERNSMYAQSLYHAIYENISSSSNI